MTEHGDLVLVVYFHIQQFPDVSDADFVLNLGPIKG